MGEQGILVHNSKCSEFKKIDPNIFESNNNLSKGTFHRTIKPKIISKVKPNYKVGYNPDIMLNKMGDIAYQGAKSKHFQETGLNIATILKELLG